MKFKQETKLRKKQENKLIDQLSDVETNFN